MTRDDLPKDVIGNKEQRFRQMRRLVEDIHLSRTALPWTTRFMLCMWNASSLMPQRGRMSPNTPLSTLFGKVSSSPAGQCAWKEATLYSSFLSAVQFNGCSPCILTNFRNAVLPHSDISSAKGFLPISHLYQLRARQILALCDKAQRLL